MRYYNIVIANASTGEEEKRFTSFLNNKTIPGALNIELDILTSTFATPLGGSMVRIWGIPLKDITQSSDFNGKLISIYGGMQKGLPLANPKQSGLLVQGYIFQAFGNWEGVSQTLDFIINPGTGTVDSPKNIIHNWKKGSSLSTAISSTLKTAFPDYTVNMNINGNLVLNRDDQGFYQTVEQYATYVKSISQEIVGGDYPGVDIALKEKEFSVYDGTTSKTPVDIAFQDLIGQPTWIESPNIQIRAVMRADLSIGDYIRLPKGLSVTTQQARSSLINIKTAFQGVFQIAKMRHVGNFRQQDASSWVTIMEAYPTQLQEAA